MNIYQTWFTFYTFNLTEWRDVDWQSKDCNECLAIMLSDCNPYIWGDNTLSADPATWGDFVKIWGNIEEEKTIEDARKCVLELYDYYDRTFCETFNNKGLPNRENILPDHAWNRYANVIKSLNNKDYKDKNEWFDLMRANKDEFLKKPLSEMPITKQRLSAIPITKRRLSAIPITKKKPEEIQEAVPLQKYKQTEADKQLERLVSFPLKTIKEKSGELCLDFEGYALNISSPFSFTMGNETILDKQDIFDENFDEQVLRFFNDDVIEDYIMKDARAGKLGSFKLFFKNGTVLEVFENATWSLNGFEVTPQGIKIKENKMKINGG